MRSISLLLVFIVYLLMISGCKNKESDMISFEDVRQLVDTVGFAQYVWQMDTIMVRIKDRGWDRTNETQWRLAICPSDDYIYVSTFNES